jgi:probable HAF family extracellular repeat protein
MLLLFALAGSLAGQEYIVSDLDPGHATGLAAALRIAESGTVVGLAVPSGGEYSYATYWTAEGTFFLPNLPGDEVGVAEDVSEQGIIVGETDKLEDVGTYIKIYPHAVIWYGGQAIPLSSLVFSGPAGYVPWNARRINEKGQLCGYGRYDNNPPAHGFFFENGELIDLGASTIAWDMNEQGHVVGEGIGSGSYRAFLWIDGQMIDLHDPALFQGHFSRARAINEFGVIAGEADYTSTGATSETATLWDHGAIVNLGTLGGSSSMVRDINDHGTVVGVSSLSGFGVHAFIHRNGAMEDLNDLIPPGSGWVLANAYSITNSGIIVGDGFTAEGGPRPFILVPDMQGGFQVYGAGCPGSGGYTPGLHGQGHPTSNGDISVVVTNGFGQAPGLLLFGTGHDTLPFQGCDLQILPLLPVQVFLQLQGTGPGAGVWQHQAQLPSGLTPSLINLQVLLMDPGGFAVTNPLEMKIY